MQITLYTLRVLKQMLVDPTKAKYGLQLAQATNLQSGTVYPILNRLIKEGWLIGRSETRKQQETGGRSKARIYYKLTPEGLQKAKKALENCSTALA